MPQSATRGPTGLGQPRSASPTSPVTPTGAGNGGRSGASRPDRGPERQPPPTELPHWTEPPTGQVPAVLSRDPGDEDPDRRSARRSGARRMPTGLPTTRSSSRPCSATTTVALGSLDETDSSEPNVGPGSSTSTRRHRRVGIRPSTDRGPGRRHGESTIAPHHRAGGGSAISPDDHAEFSVVGGHDRTRSCSRLVLRSIRTRRRRRPPPARGGMRRRLRPTTAPTPGRACRCRRPPRIARPTDALVRGREGPSDRLDPSRPRPAQRTAAGAPAGQAPDRCRRGHRCPPGRGAARGIGDRGARARVASGEVWRDWPPPTARADRDGGLPRRTTADDAAPERSRRSPMAWTSPPPPRSPPESPAAGRDVASLGDRCSGPDDGPRAWTDRGRTAAAPPTRGARRLSRGRSTRSPGAGAPSGSGSGPGSPSRWSPCGIQAGHGRLAGPLP